MSTRALWVVRDSEPESLVYGITRALFNPANYEALAASHPSAREIGLATAALCRPRRCIRARRAFIAKKAAQRR